MFPKRSVWERIRNKPPSVYGSIEHTFYAFKIDKPPMIPNMWKENKPEIQISSPKDRTYFSLNTMVGVGAKGQNNIKSVHIRFVLMPMRDDIPKPEVVSICPTNISTTVGDIKEMRKSESELSAGGGANAGYGFLDTIFAKFNAGFRRSRTSTKTKESILPNKLLIANASGTTNRAIWEFYRGDGIEAIGQYNLEIIFRIKGSPAYEKRFCYCVDWNIEVNGKKLWDHKVELKNKRWNVKFNGKKLMDYMNGDDKKELMDYMNGDDKKELMDYMNDMVSWRTIRPELEQSLLMKLRLRKKQTLEKLIQEDDPDIDKRLLRPLILFDSRQEIQPSKNLNTSPSSWNTKIKDIDSCPSLMVEATVLSNPKKIKNQRNSKLDTLMDITYLLLGDDTGVIVLIEDDEKLDKLNQWKMGDIVRVIGAEGNEVFYRDLGGIQGILKYRHTDLYVKESTCIENCEDKISYSQCISGAHK